MSRSARNRRIAVRGVEPGCARPHLGGCVPVLSTPPQIVARRIRDLAARVVELSGEHDVSTASELAGALAVAVASGDAVIVDLRRATFADSAILGAIVRANRNAQRCCFAVVMPPPGEVSRLFDLVAARSVLLTFPTMRLAVKWCYPALENHHEAI